ncbi:putative vhs domain-containing protein [Echria macrotheca]|uniref:Vhs domain-containing protein n=1 Tax=Echria macrotheca TaxID=438768 RepID=A0AAJ0BJS0_9PEZI|nr:putative vhs domain-containing protein [Echria macrotheca]
MFSQKKPYTSVTVTVERLTSEGIPENDLSGIPDLVEVINLQDTGPAEAARALRKKLKYGNVHRQLRALTLLDGLIQNAGPRFQRTFADEPLLERLRFCGTASTSAPEVKKKCAELFRSWAADYKGIRGMEQVASLYKELPKRKHVVTQEKSKVIRETENPFGEDDDEPAAPSGPSGSHSRKTSAFSGVQPPAQVQSFSYTSKDKKKDKDKKSKKKNKPFNLEAEKEKMKAHIAEASIAATKLMNTLQTINREKERISENQTAVERFEDCKQLRRKILRYIYHVESEEWLGTLLNANDSLITALLTYEQLDRSIDADSDSDDDLAQQAHLYRMATEKAKGKEPGSPGSKDSGALAAGMAGLRFSPSPPPQPPRPSPPPRPSAASKPSHLTQPRKNEPSDDEDDDSVNDEDENDPFADRNALKTPKMESDEPKWS